MISGKRLIYLIFMVLSIACQKVPAGSDCPCGTETGTTSVCFSIQTAEIKSGSRSSMAINDKTIKSLNIFVYRDGILAAEVYSDNTSPASIELTSGGTYNFYTLANTGRLAAPAEESELSSYRYRIQDTGDLESKGLPMSARNEGILVEGPGKRIDIFLERLVSKINFKIDSGAISGLEVSSVRLVNSPKDVAPFIPGGSAATEVIAGDYATSADISAVNSGKTATFYMLENCQGELLPGNKDPWYKVPEHIPSGKAGLCTYMEVEAELDGSSGMAGPVKYRFYLGKNETSDFTIVRNTENTVTLITTEDGLGKISWKIENGDLLPVSIPVVVAADNGIIYYTREDGTLEKTSAGSANWNDVIYASGRYVFVGENGNIAATRDFSSWEKATSGTSALKAVTYGENRFVAVGENGSISYSTDGKSWKQVSTGTQSWTDIAYGNGIFVAVGNSGTRSWALGWSEDGVSWTSKSSSSYKNICKSVTFGDGKFVGVGDRASYSGTSGYSTDGKNWTLNNYAGSVLHYCVTYGDGEFVALGRNESILSPDGISWDMDNFPMLSEPHGITFSDGIYAATGNKTSTESGFIVYSSDGSKWFSAVEDDLGTDRLNSICVMERKP